MAGDMSLLCGLLALGICGTKTELLQPPIVSAARNPHCPIVDDLQHPVQLPHPSNCSYYYSCQRGFAYIMACPQGLYWSMLTYRCDYAEVAKCFDASNSVSTNTTFTPATPTSVYTPLESISENTLYQPYVNDCSRYLQCQVMHCSAQFHWNARLQRCDSPQSAMCAQSSQPQPYTAPTLHSGIPTAATPPITPAPYAGASTSAANASASELNALCNNKRQRYIAYPGDCHRFIQCNGIAFEHKCPANLLWNSQLLACDHQCK